MSALQTQFIQAPQPNSRRLMIVLHGLGDSIEGYSWMPSALRTPWLNYLLVNAPDPYYGGFSWFDFMGAAEPGIRRSRKLLFDLLDAQRAAGWPSDQTIMFGFSQGCLMTAEIGCRYPHLLAGLIGVSGFIFEPEKLVRELSPVALQQRFLLTHGTMDPLIPISAVRSQLKVLQGAGLRVEWREYAKEHTIAGQEELDLIREFVCECFGEKQSAK
jgi:phospholipase/carboxylesterase